MDLYKELISGQGYAIYPIERIDIFKKLRDSFIEKMTISTKSEKNINEVRKIMAKCLRQKLIRPW